MKRFAAGLTALALVGSLAMATPAQAQSFSFGFNIGRPHVSFCERHPFECRPSWWGHRPRARVRVDIGPFELRLRGSRLRSHIARCETHFHSYDKRTDMYLGFDGDWHRCRL